MDTLVSLKNSYADFKQTYELDLVNAKGQLKNGLKYGEFYKLPTEEKRIVFYFTNQKDANHNMKKVLNGFAQKGLEQQYTFTIVAGKKVAREEIPQKFQANIVVPTSQKAIKAFAIAKYVIANGNLPLYFVKKEEQKVIQLFDKIDEKPDGRKISQNRVSWMLNSSVIFVEQGDKEKFMEYYEIPEEYADRVKQIPQNEDQGQYVADEMDNTDVIPKVKSSKKNILLIASSWELGGHEETYIKLIANNIDYDKYDFTLVVKRPANGKSEEVLQSINDKMRIVYRKGTFSCTEDEYIKTQYLLKNFDAFEDIDEAQKKLDREIIDRECKRIFGDMEFSEVLYLGRHSAVWSMITECLNTDHRIRIINHSLSEELAGYKSDLKQLGFYNKLKIYDKIFDNIVFTASRYKEDSVAEEYFKVSKVTYFEFPNCEFDRAQPTQARYTQYQGKKYYIGQQYEYVHGGMKVILFPVPEEDKEAYIANGDLCDKDILMQMFAKICEQNDNSLLVIYGKESADIRQYAKQYGLDKKIEIMERKTLETIATPGQYLNSFEGCLITGDREEYCLISTIIELLGKKIIMLENGELTECTDPKFKNLDEYNTYAQGLWNQLFNGEVK